MMAERSAWRGLGDLIDLAREARRLSGPLGLAGALRLSRALRRGSGEVRVDWPDYPNPIYLRAGTSDVDVFREVHERRAFDLDHGERLELIIDAGAYIGLTTAHFARRYPHATVIAVEPDPGNFALLERNTVGLKNVVNVNAALWVVDGEVPFASVDLRSWASHVADPRAEAGARVPAVTVRTLLERAGKERVDLLKLDIEGAELELFEAERSAWLHRVGVILAELHDWRRPGCSAAFYRALAGYDFCQSLHAEKVLIRLGGRRTG